MFSGISSHIPSSGNMQGARMSDGGTETEDQQRLRFMVELEFVQCLANPNYLNFLAQRGYFKDQSFINYLKYLLYWKEPDYARYLKYPMCLYFLDLLQYEHFRREVVNAQCTKFIDDQQILLWQHYTRRRTRLLQSQIGSQNSVGVGVGGMNVGGVIPGQQPISTGGSTPIQSGQGGQTPNQTLTRKT